MIAHVAMFINASDLDHVTSMTRCMSLYVCLSDFPVETGISIWIKVNLREREAYIYTNDPELHRSQPQQREKQKQKQFPNRKHVP